MKQNWAKLSLVTFIFCAVLYIASYRHVIDRFTIRIEEQEGLSHLTCQQEYDQFTIEQNVSIVEPDVLCRRKLIKPENSCEYMKETLEKSVDKCGSHHKLQLCTPSTPTLSQLISFNCSFAIEYCSKMSFGVIDAAKGDVSWTSVDSKQLETKLEKLSQTNTFIFLQCEFEHDMSRYNYQKTKQGKYQQLLLMPHKIQMMQQQSDRKSDSTVTVPIRPVDSLPSFNILFLDSTSRTKFYRSYTETVQLLKSYQQSNEYEVFDFHLFQSIAYDTYWHFINFFNGPHSKWENLYKHEDFMFYEGKDFFKNFKDLGYKTIYVWDRCWKHLAKRGESVAKRYELYHQFKNMSYIDSVGIGDANCELLKASDNVIRPYSSGQKCFNGEHLQYYELNGLLEQQRMYNSMGFPFVSFSEDNNGHNSDATFVKFSDPHLRNHIDEVNKLGNVITLIFADHGNRETAPYLKNYSPEGKTDVTHTFLFVIIPNSLKKLFSKQELTAMRKNQHRLITVRDVYPFFSKFWNESIEENSILVEKSKNFTCSHLYYGKPPMSQFCICEDYGAQYASMAKSQTALKYIQDTVNEMTKHHRSVCTEVLLKLNENKVLTINQDRINGSDVRVLSGLFVSKKNNSRANRKNDLPLFQVFLTENSPDLDQFSILSIHRIDEYGKYEHCTPQGLNPKFCICD